VHGNKREEDHVSKKNRLGDAILQKMRCRNLHCGNKHIYIRKSFALAFKGFHKPYLDNASSVVGRGG